jgi:CheY-like chemotaxis protein
MEVPDERAGKRSGISSILPVPPMLGSLEKSWETSMKRLLIIDDDKAVGNAIKTWLEVEGAEVTHLEDGGSGIEAIESGRFDLVIVDLLMPGLDGLETIEILHRVKPDLPIIVMSALTCPLDGSDVMQRATELGAVSALYKPFRPSDLMRAIEISLGGPLRPDTLGTEPGP